MARTLGTMVTEPGPSWSDIAEWYDDLVEGGSGPHQTGLDCLARLLPEVHGIDVVDVGCGQGLASRLLASRGARVVGVDSSAAMIDLARQHGTPSGPAIEYWEGDAQTLAHFDHDTFDGAVSHLALMDIPDLDSTLAAVHRVLRPGGWFAFVISHPCFLVPGAERVEVGETAGLAVTGYFRERFWRSSNPSGVRRAGNYHRMLSTYLNALIDASFHIEEVDEPIANELLARQQPVYSQVPIFFAARVRAHT